jgi:hypothetical protein
VTVLIGGGSFCDIARRYGGRRRLRRVLFRELEAALTTVVLCPSLDPHFLTIEGRTSAD